MAVSLVMGSCIRNTVSPLVQERELSASTKTIQPFCQAPLQFVPVVEAQMPTFMVRLIASLRARLKSAMSSFACVVNRWLDKKVRKFGIAIASKIPAIVRAMINSMKVSPTICLLMTNGLFLPIKGMTDGIFWQTNGNVRDIKIWPLLSTPRCNRLRCINYPGKVTFRISMGDKSNW